MVTDDDFQAMVDELVKLQARVDRIEGLEAQPEPVQSLVPAAGCGVEYVNREFQPAGYPDGHHWTEGFEGFLKEQLEIAEMAHRRNPCGPTSVRPRILAMVMNAFLFHKGLGAA